MTLTQDYQRLRSVLKSIPDTIHAVLSTSFQFHTAVVPGEASGDRRRIVKNRTIDLNCDIIAFDKILQHIRKVQAGTIKCRFRIDNRWRSLTDNWAGEPLSLLPKRRAGYRNTPSEKTRVNIFHNLRNMTRGRHCISHCLVSKS